MSEKVLGYNIEVELAADGKAIDMNEFVRSIFQNTIKGMLSALRIPEDSKEVTLKVRLKR
jgi:hypothetical protein